MRNSESNEEFGKQSAGKEQPVLQPGGGGPVVSGARPPRSTRRPAHRHQASLPAAPHPLPSRGQRRRPTAERQPPPSFTFSSSDTRSSRSAILAAVCPAPRSACRERRAADRTRWRRHLNCGQTPRSGHRRNGWVLAVPDDKAAASRSPWGSRSSCGICSGEAAVMDWTNRLPTRAPHWSPRRAPWAETAGSRRPEARPPPY